MANSQSSSVYDASARMRGKYLSGICMLAMVVAALSGCRSNPGIDAYIANLDAEKRGLEDIIYQQQAENRELLKMLRKCEANGKSRSDGGTEPGGDLDDPAPAIEAPDLEFGTESPPEMQSGKPSIPDTVEPDVDLDPPVSPGPSRPRRDVLPSPQGHSGRPVSLPARGVDAEVSHIVLNRRETAGLDEDGEAGDEGLRVVFEPRNRQETFLPTFGRVSVVVLDPQLSGEAARVARWDFSADEVYQAIRDTRTDKGVVLTMRWPGGRPPQHSNLRLYVRLELEDGTRHELDDEIVVHLPRIASLWESRPTQKRDTRIAKPQSEDRVTRQPEIRCADVAVATMEPDATTLGRCILIRAADTRRASSGL